MKRQKRKFKLELKRQDRYLMDRTPRRKRTPLRIRRSGYIALALGASGPGDAEIVDLTEDSYAMHMESRFVLYEYLEQRF